MIFQLDTSLILTRLRPPPLNSLMKPMLVHERPTHKTQYRNSKPRQENTSESQLITIQNTLTPPLRKMFQLVHIISNPPDLVYRAGVAIEFRV